MADPLPEPAAAPSSPCGVERHPLCIAADHPSLAGHFPGRPIVPGVVILDAVVEAALSGRAAGHRLARLPQIKFLQPLLPAQDAEIELSAATAATNGQQRLRFRVLRDDEAIATGELLFVPVDGDT